MGDQTSETRRRKWCLEHAACYDTTPATLYMLLGMGDQEEIGVWVGGVGEKEHRRLRHLQQAALRDYRADVSATPDMSDRTPDGQTCDQCSALVTDMTVHLAWHAAGDQALVLEELLDRITALEGDR